MPYGTNQELPDSVKDSLPDAAQDIFRKSFNAALKKYEKEDRAFKIAWAAVRKAGYKKMNDKWTKESEIDGQQNLEEMFVGFNVTSFEQLEAEQLAIEKAMKAEELTGAFCRMIENIMASDEIENKAGEISSLTASFISRLNDLQEAEQRKVIEQNAENEVELTEAELSPITELSETESGPLRAMVRIIKPGWGNKRNNHYYPKDVLQRDAYQFVGAKMYETDHNPQEKSTRTWVSTIEDIVGFDNGAPLAKVAVHDEGFAERLRNLSSLNMLEKMECSIYANGLAKSGFKLDGREGKQVEAITGVSSVDWVTRAGAGGAAVSLIENDDKENGMTEEIDVKNEDVQEVDARDEAAQEEAVEEVEITESEAELVEEKQGFMDVSKIKDVLSETDLPKYAQTRLAYSGRFTSEEEVREAAQAELEYIKAVTRSGKPFGMNKQAEKKPENKNMFAEADNEKNELAREFMGLKK